MKTYLTYKDDKSDKFWHIETQGNSFTVIYGKTNTSGTSQTKTFESDEKCLKEAEKLVAEKKKKGYLGTAKGAQRKSIPSDFKSAWEVLLKSKDRHVTLMNHFGYLASSKSSSEQLNLILKLVTDVFISEKDELCLKLSVDNLFLVATAPNKNIDLKWPKSFQQYQQKHEFIILTDRKNIIALTLGDTGTLPLDELAENMDSEKFANVVSPVSEMSDWWIYHPIKRIKGEPQIYLVDHEDMEISNSFNENAGELFLKRCVEILNVEKDNKLSTEKSIYKIYAIKESSELFKSTQQILRLNETDILLFGWETLSHLELTSDKIVKNDKVKIESSFSGSELKASPDGDFLVWISGSSSFLVSVTNRKIKIAQKIAEKPRATVITATKSGDKIYYYYDNAGFYERKIAGGSINCFRKEAYNENLFIKDSAVIQDQLIFVGQKFIINFEIIEGKQPKELSKLKENFSWPKILSLNNEPFFIVFETESNSAPAISIFSLNQKIKKLATFRSGESALCWQLYKDELWVITESVKYSKKESISKYFCLQFKWKSGNLFLKKDLEVDFKHDDSLFLKYMHVLENEIILINKEGIVWRLPI